MALEDFSKEEQELAVALHDLECSDKSCEPTAFAHLFPRARRLIEMGWTKS